MSTQEEKKGLGKRLSLVFAWGQNHDLPSQHHLFVYSFVCFVAGSVRSLCYDTERRVLFSGGFDELVVVWDIGSQKGTAYELMGHKYALTLAGRREIVIHFSPM